MPEPRPRGWLLGSEDSRPPDLTLADFSRDGTLGEPGARVQVIMTAITNEADWVLSQGRLEQQRCSFRYSSEKEGP